MFYLINYPAFALADLHLPLSLPNFFKDASQGYDQLASYTVVFNGTLCRSQNPLDAFLIITHNDKGDHHLVAPLTVTYDLPTTSLINLYPPTYCLVSWWSECISASTCRVTQQGRFYRLSTILSLPRYRYHLSRKG